MTPHKKTEVFKDTKWRTFKAVLIELRHYQLLKESDWAIGIYLLIDGKLEMEDRSYGLRCFASRFTKVEAEAWLERKIWSVKNGRIVQFDSN